ncbi:MAG TPA: hypothetical protein VGL89_15355 [Candidatus Koribacter sp.]|jgi:hypothetical protein
MPLNTPPPAAEAQHRRRLRLVLTLLICAAVFLTCVYLNIEAPLYDRGFGTNELNVAKSDCVVQNILSAWGQDPVVDHCAEAVAAAAQPVSANATPASLPDEQQARLERDNVTSRAKLSYYVDFGMIAIYLAGLLAAIKLFAADTPGWIRRSRILYVLAVGAATCDVVENFSSLHKIASGSSMGWIWLATYGKLAFFLVAIGLLAMIALLRGAPWKTNGPIVVRAIYHLRVPLLVQLGMAGLAYMDATSAGFAKMSRGIFDVERWKGTMLVSMLFFLLAWSALILTRIILAYGAERFYGAGRDPAPPNVNAISFNVQGKMYWSTLALYSLPAWYPIARVIGVAEDFQNRWLKLPFVALGALAAIFLLFAIDLLRLHERERDSGNPHDFALPFQQTPSLKRLRDDWLGKNPIFGDRAWFRWTFRKLGPGFTAAETGAVGSGHLLAFCAMIVLSLLYVLSIWLHGETWLYRVFPPVVLWFVVIVTGIALWVGSFLTFWLDLYRIPLLVAVVLLASGLGLIRKDDHYIATNSSAQEKSVTPEQFVGAWLDRHKGDGSPLVVVTSAGGGIQAAAWTEKVLTSLEKATASCRTDFRSSVLLMSSVSGGSVGVMYYADSYREHPNVHAVPNEEELEELAGRSSLAAVGWGIAYPDNLAVRPLVLLFGDETLDRASAMQQAWGRGWDGAAATLADWRKAAAGGTQPAVILNSTVIETGQRMEISNVDPMLPDGDAAASFEGQMPSCDVDVLTATRLSATFPWVSPVARTIPQSCGGKYSYHFADGGYYDNFGVDSAVDWLTRSNLEKRGLEGHKLLWLQIIAFPDDPLPAAKSWGWLDQGMAPVNGMMDVRTMSQRENARQLRDGYIGRFGDTKTNKAYQFVYQGQNAPLSWHLLRSQKHAIDQTWDWYEGLNDSDFYKVRAEFCGEVSGTTASPLQGEGASE